MSDFANRFLDLVSQIVCVLFHKAIVRMLESPKFKEEVVKKINVHIDIPVLNEEAEEQLISSVVEAFTEVI